MKRKTLFLLSILAISATLLSACKSADSVDSSEMIETTAVESEATESTKITEETTEEVEETTEESTEESTEETEITFEKGEPISEKDLNFPFLGYDTYIDYINAGNNYSAYIIAGNAKMIETGEFIDEGDTIESTVRGIKLGDSLEKMFEIYGQADAYDKYDMDCFSHDGKRDEIQYLYFFKTDSTKDYFYSFRFIFDQNNELIGFILEPLDMKYWSE